MLWLVRIIAYVTGGLTAWHFLQNGPSPADIFPLHGQLMLDQTNGMVLGVCAGLSRYTGVDVTVIRLAWLLASLYRWFGFVIYILAFLIMPVSGT